MDAASDELTRPVGQDRPLASPARRSSSLLRLAAAGCVALAVGIAGFVLVRGDPRGGTPSVDVLIVERPAVTSQTAAAKVGPAPSEPSSGVTVAGPAGPGAPGALILRLPDDVPSGPAAAPPDTRLLERTRHGLLPRQAPDGSRAVDAYARPVGELPGGARPAGRVALVVGGLGISRAATADALAKLPAAVSLAFAPYGSDLERVAAQAREGGHEILLQLPMEPFDYPDSDPGPHTLKAEARPADNIDHLHWALGRFTGYVGAMNYMGGKLTSDERALQPILRELGARGLGFLDDGSSARSRVAAAAGETRTARAAVVVDAVPRADLVDKALAQLEGEARSGAIAVGTASAFPVTLERVRAWAAGLEARGILLVPVSAALGVRSRDAATR